jgi:hypothetical protein
VTKRARSAGFDRDVQAAADVRLGDQVDARDPLVLAEREPERHADLPDSADPVPDEVWDEAARHYDEQGMAALVLKIAVTNVFNRLNRVTRQIAGAW